MNNIFCVSYILTTFADIIGFKKNG